MERRRGRWAALAGCWLGAWAGFGAASAQDAPAPLHLPAKPWPAPADALPFDLPGVPSRDPAVRPVRLDSAAAEEPVPPQPAIPQPALPGVEGGGEEAAVVPGAMPRALASPAFAPPAAPPVLATGQGGVPAMGHTHPVGVAVGCSHGEGRCGAGDLARGAGHILQGVGGIVRGTGRLVGCGLHALGSGAERLCECGDALLHGGHHAMQRVARGIDPCHDQPAPQPPPQRMPPPPLLSPQSGP